MLEFLITALLIGVVVVYGVPRVNGLLAKAPGAARVTGNRFFQLLVVGAVVMLGLLLFTKIAGKLKI
jgi:hypothetical protein